MYEFFSVSFVFLPIRSFHFAHFVLLINSKYTCPIDLTLNQIKATVQMII